MIGPGFNPKSIVTVAIPGQDYDLNSVYEVQCREGVRINLPNVPIVKGIGSHTIDIFKFTGAIEIVNQYAILTEVNELVNLTNMYADIHDGTNTVLLTKDGAVLSGASVDTFFSKAQLVTETYSVLLADECRLLETDQKKTGRPFMINGKNGVDNFIRLNFATSTGVDFKMDVFFTYTIPDGGTLALP